MDGIIKTIEKTKNIFYQYNDKLPIGIENYYLEILKGINIEHYEEMYGISKNELIKYARICRMDKGTYAINTIHVLPNLPLDQ